MKPLAGERRLGEYNFSIVLVILLQEHISFHGLNRHFALDMVNFCAALQMCGFDDQRKCKSHAGYPRISSNSPISPVYKYNFPLFSKHCWRYIIKLIG